MSEISKRSRTIKKKKKKDPKAPKRPRSAYILFCTKQRSHTKADNPNDKPSELMKKMGDLWKNMTDDDKVPYEEEAKHDKERYQNEMQSYAGPPDDDDDDSDGSPAAKRKPKKVKKAKDPNAPKKPMSAYLMFGNTQRAKIKQENPDMKSADIMKKIAEEWKKLTSTEKEPYEHMAKRDKERFEAESAGNKKKAAKPVSDEEEDEEDEEEDNGGGGADDDDDEDDDDEDDD